MTDKTSYSYTIEQFCKFWQESDYKAMLGYCQVFWKDLFEDHLQQLKQRVSGFKILKINSLNPVRVNENSDFFRIIKHRDKAEIKKLSYNKVKQILELVKMYDLTDMIDYDIKAKAKFTTGLEKNVVIRARLLKERGEWGVNPTSLSRVK